MCRIACQRHSARQINEISQHRVCPILGCPKGNSWVSTCKSFSRIVRLAPIGAVFKTLGGDPSRHWIIRSTGCAVSDGQGGVMEQAIQANGIPARFAEKAERELVTSRGAGPNRARRTLLVIDSRVRDRECLVRSIAAKRADMDVLAHGSFAEWNQVYDLHPPLAAVLVNIGGRSLHDLSFAEEIRKLTSEFGATPVVVLARPQMNCVKSSRHWIAVQGATFPRHWESRFVSRPLAWLWPGAFLCRPAAC